MDLARLKREIHYFVANFLYGIVSRFVSRPKNYIVDESEDKKEARKH
jgi:hypothetical protein